jgi:RIO-like serine/threonine protein kinase
MFETSDHVRVLVTLKTWGILSEKRISNLSKMSHRRCSTNLEKLAQDRLVKLVENSGSSRSYRITGSGLDYLDKMKQKENSLGSRDYPSR